MKLLIAGCVLVMAQLPILAQQYDHYDSSRTGDSMTWNFYDKNNHVLHTITGQQSSGMFRIQTADHKEAWVHIENGIESGDVVRSTTTSSGKSLQIKLHYGTGGDTTKGRAVMMSIWQGNE